MDKTSKPGPAKRSGISRREFARRAAFASAAAAVAPAAAMSASATPLPAAPLNDAALSEQQAADLPKLSPESHAEVEARIQSVFAQYGSRFSDVQKADIRRLCAAAQPSLDRLRAYTMENGDGPGLYLKPLVEREKNPLEGTRVGKTPDAAKRP
jgi:hypothetical protein